MSEENSVVSDRKFFGVILILVGIGEIFFTGFFCVSIVFFAPRGQFGDGGTLLKQLRDIFGGLVLSSMIWFIPFSIGFGLAKWGSNLCRHPAQTQSGKTSAFEDVLTFFCLAGGGTMTGAF